MADLSRRGFIGGLVGIVAAPAIVRVASIMLVKSYPPPPWLAEVKRMAEAWPEASHYPIIVHPSLYLDLAKRPEYSDRLARGMILQQLPIPVAGARVGINRARA